MITRDRRLHHTGSKIHRVWMCPASAVLPHTTNEDHEARTEPARGKGQLVHRYLERVRVDGVDAALSEVPEDLQTMCRALDINRLPTHLDAEVAFAWNWRDSSARELGRSPNLPRKPDGAVDYEALGIDWSCELGVTVDVCGFAEVSPPGSMETIRRGYVGDYKTGHTKYPRPARFGQILLGAICIRDLYQLDDVIGELLYLDDDGECYPQRDTLDQWTLDSFERELGEIMADLPNLAALAAQHGPGMLRKHEGPHCDHCPAFKDCSAKTALVKAIPEALLKLGARRTPKGDYDLVWVPELDKDKKPKADGSGTWEMQLQPGAITVRNAAAVYEACERIEALCRRMREEVCGIAYAGESIELSDGRVIEKYVSKRSTTDGKVAASVMERWLLRNDPTMAPEAARKAVLEKVDVKLTLGAIGDLVRSHIDWKKKPRPVLESKKGDGVLDKLLKELEASQGLFVNSSEECKPHKPRGKKA
jgi:hypothetical protein